MMVSIPPWRKAYQSMYCMYVCIVSIYIAHYRMELNPDLMTLFRFQFGRCDWTHHRMFNVISLKAIKDPCVMRAAFRRRDCYRFLTGSAGFRNQSLIAFFQSVDALIHYTTTSPKNEWLQAYTGQHIGIKDIAGLSQVPFFLKIVKQNTTAGFKKSRIWPFNRNAIPSFQFTPSLVTNRPGS